jgi:hypothetical protein
MRAVLKALSQMAVMAAIVATLACIPVGAALAFVLHQVGVPVVALLTLDGSVHAAFGLVLWWLIVFAGSCGYAAWAYPWEDRRFGWPRGR